MKSVRHCVSNGAWAIPMQAIAECSSVSRSAIPCHSLNRRRLEERKLTLSYVRNLHCVAPDLLAWSSLSRSLYRRRSVRPIAFAGLSFELSPATAAVLTSTVSFVLLRVFIYFRMEYITAAMLGRHVPRGGARVVELDIREGRNLYYYPSDIVQVVAVSTKPNRTLLENQAIKAGVPIQIKTQGPTSLGLPSNSMDAVVSASTFSSIPDEEVKNVLCEAVRVLQPGKPFIFVEPVGAKNPFVQAAQSVLQDLLKLTGSKKTLTRDLVQYIQEVDELENLKYEELFGLFDPQIVGVARKKISVESPSQGSLRSKRGFRESKS
ncbi:hypothetical protein R1sor_001393 [Riccia sorocarpa]|uniref:Methyltransferase type 11 domain-containing protein n=1 Tax=Riccia sorocarpa TaxID=122646 RepID=A0ABD3GXS8_9MARC